MADVSILAQNIRALRKHLELNQADFASRLGADQSLISRWEKHGMEPSRDYLLDMARLAECDAAAFVKELWTPRTKGHDQQNARNDDGDDVQIQEWDISYGMGGGTYLDLPVTGEPHTFSRSWLRHFTHAPPEKVFLARGAGDSMTPTILDTDMVLIDTSERQVRIGDKIWALVYGTTGYIKRVRPMPDGSVKMLSDNPAVPPETAYDGEMSIVGRVAAIIRKT